jgi:hypothetical protein
MEERRQSGVRAATGVLAGGDGAPFEAAALCRRAAEQTGVADARSHVDAAALEALCASFADEAPQLTLLGRKRAEYVITESIAKALRLHQHRDSRTGPRTALPPVTIIVAPFRTGTTLLHRLLAQDPDTRWVRAWESAYAPPAPGRLAGDERGTDPRIALADRAFANLARWNPALRDIHEAGTHLPEECFGLLETSLCSHSFMFYGAVESYLSWLDSRDERAWAAAYATYRAQLELQAQAPGRRWLLKSPVHMWNIEALHATFPGARFVQLHRDAAQAVPSFCSLLAANYAFTYRSMDPRRVGRIASRYATAALARAAGARARLPDECFMDIAYDALVADPMAVVRKIYPWTGDELSADAEARMTDWLSDTRRTSRHAYAAESYGLDPGALRADVAPYAGASRRTAGTTSA